MNQKAEELTAAEAPRRPEILAREDGAAIAYHRVSGKSPGVVFCTGFKSDMTGSKALTLEDHCRKAGRAFLRFDYRGHGQSSGTFEEGTVGDWTDDAVFALDNLTEGPQVLVGSSMGGWIVLLMALRRPERIAGILGLAAAPDFTEELIWATCDDEQRASLERNGFFDVPNCYDDEEPYRITRRLIEEGCNHLILGSDIPIDVPVRLIHGLLDEDVPWKTAERLSERLTSADVEVTLVKSGGHRLSEPHDIDRLTRTLDGLLRVVEG